jgi:hypothetical protein
MGEIICMFLWCRRISEHCSFRYHPVDDSKWLKSGLQQAML